MKALLFLLLGASVLSTMVSCVLTIRNYNVVGSLEEDTRAFLVTSSPSLLLDTFNYDDDKALLLGKGNFKQSFQASGNLSNTSYAIVIEKPGYAPHVSPVSSYLMGKAVLKIEQPPTSKKAAPKKLPVDINIGEFSFEVTGGGSFNSSEYLDRSYHTTYSLKDDEDDQDNRTQSIETQALKYVTDLIVKLKSEKTNDSIPVPAANLAVKMIYKPGSGSYYYYEKPTITYSLDLNDHKGDDVEYDETTYTLDGSEDIFNLLIEDIFDLFDEADEGLKKMAKDYKNEIRTNLINWKTLRFPLPTSKGNSKQSVVTIKSDNGHGSGVVVSTEGYILTNNHVIDGAKTLHIIDENEKEYDALVIRTNPIYDIALLQAQDSSQIDASTPLFKNTIAVSHDYFDVGTDVLCIGSPLDPELNGSISEGIVTAISTTYGRKHYVVSSTVNPGNSGGALVNNNGELIGVVNAKLVGGSVKNIGFAIPIKDIEEQLNIRFETNTVPHEE